MTDDLGDLVQNNSNQTPQNDNSDSYYHASVENPDGSEVLEQMGNYHVGKPKRGWFKKTLAAALLTFAGLGVTAAISACNPFPNTPPRVEVSVPSTAQSGKSEGINATITENNPGDYVANYTVSAVGPDGKSHQISQGQGNGQQIINYSGSYTFSSSGNYTVKVTAVDKHGLPGNGSASVNVSGNTTTQPTPTPTPTPDPTPTPSAPQVDLTKILNNDIYNSTQNSPNVDEETQSTIQLPLTDTDGNPITYTTAKSINGFVTLDTSQLSSGKLGIKGNSTSNNEDYSVNLTFKDNKTTQTGTTELKGINYNHPGMILQSIQDDETHTSQNGDFRFFGVYKDTSKNTVASPNGVSMGHVNIEGADAGTVENGSSGYLNQLYLPSGKVVNLQIGVRASDLSSLVVESWMTDNTGNQISFVRTVDGLPPQGFSNSTDKRMNPAIRVVPYGGKYPIQDLNGDGVVNEQDYQLFKQYMLQVSSLLGGLVKFDDPNTEIVKGNPNDSSVTFSSLGESLIKSALQYWSNVISGTANGGTKIRNGFNSPLLTAGNTPVYYDPSTGNFSALGWSVIMPGTIQNVWNGNDGLSQSFPNPNNTSPLRLYNRVNAWTYLIPQVYGAQVYHEVALQKVFSGETTVLGPRQSMMNAGTDLSRPTFVDDKGAMIVYEETCLNGDSENNILGFRPTN